MPVFEREGYEMENVNPLPDDFEPRFQVGERVVVNEDAEMFGGEEGEVYGIGLGYGPFNNGQTLYDVLIDGTTDCERIQEDELDAA